MEYFLNKNHLNKSQENFIGRTPAIGVINKAELIEEVAKEGTGITSYEVASIFKRLEIVMADLLKKGYRINTPIVNITPSIKGLFTDYEDSFDKSRHSLHFKTSSGVVLKQAAKETQLYKRDPINYHIDVFKFTNLSEKGENLSPNAIGELRGNNLKLNPDDLKQGIFLLAEDGKEYRINIYAHNTKNKQTFQVPPDIAPGKYILELRSLPLNSSRLKKGRLSTSILFT
ncbi:DUF4469 domain-containing protein [Ancylomarina euxinus]|uniref:DUF4469 domain-containing protein n=1 Tax=Ancylomarina euxinus TaxID=2283627 RepID=A0A425XXC1_9BACT|nr:DNA-binding domain-containing protein [Ancylomarina euxinus]MCZ4696180.1 DUF4469 domain-containing protein [Ancylomarina euxinus]MUP16589.1 DUF4469 domain-containing protein [Ancylomarina euxinus]RRG19291.1 DUF4469 domain-containing protein [Ancylomarina euxinus]